MHQPASCFFSSQTGECLLETDEIGQVTKDMKNFYVQRTGKPFSKISRDMKKDHWMSAKEAQAHGIIDDLADASSSDHIS